MAGVAMAGITATMVGMAAFVAVIMAADLVDIPVVAVFTAVATASMVAKVMVVVAASTAVAAASTAVAAASTAVVVAVATVAVAAVAMAAVVVDITAERRLTEV
jgi:hypothetical protein